MKKYRNIIFILLACALMIFPNYHPSADSGFDGGYDSGSSWSSSDSSWSSSDSSWSSSGSSYSSGTSDPLETFIALAIFLVIVGCVLIAAKGNQQGSTTSMPYLQPYDPNKIKEILPDFNENKFKTQTYDIYKQIQTAWMNFDNDAIRKLVTDEMYNMYNAQLTTLKVKHQTNVMKDFSLLDFKIVGMETKDNTISLSVIMKIECFDFIIDSTGTTVRGNDKRKVTYNYMMTFNKGISSKPNKCPNCNAPLENVNSSKCPYCDSNIINENYDWVLAKKQVLSQTVNKK